MSIRDRLCHLRKHPLVGGPTIAVCRCGRVVWVDGTDPDSPALARIRAANSPPRTAAVLTAAAQLLEERS